MLKTPKNVNPFQSFNLSSNNINNKKKINSNKTLNGNQENNYIGNNGFICDTNMKRKHHPKCSKGNETEKQRRLSVILQFFENYNSSINRNSPNRLNQIANFLNTRTSPEDRWIYRSFDRNISLNNPHIMNMNLRGKSTYRQEKLRELGSSENIKRIKNNLNQHSFEGTSHPIQVEIQQLFIDTGLSEKIKFNFDFESFKTKIETIRNLPIFGNIKDNYQSFIDRYSSQILQGEHSLKKILGDELYRELKEIGILDEISIKIYNRQYARQDRESAHIKLKIWMDTFATKIKILSSILNEIDLTNKGLESLMKGLILNTLELYLYFCNYVLREYFEKKEFLLEWAYEAIYYNTMLIYFNFINNFLHCHDEGIKNNSKFTEFGSGFFGQTFKSKNNTKILKEIKDENNNKFERVFFEFFKQNILNKLYPTYFPEVHEFIFGDNKVYIIMELINV